MNQSDYDADADKIYKACKGGGTKEEDLIQVIGHRTLAQRHQIRLRYFSKYGKDLLDELDSELSGDFGWLSRNLFLGPIQMLAFELYKIFKKSGSVGSGINDIICCCNDTELAALKVAYQEVLKYEDVKDKTRTLEKDIEKETKALHRDFLLKYIRTNRREFTHAEIENAASTGRWDNLINMSDIERDAGIIFAAADKKPSKAEEEAVMDIVAKSSTLALRALYDHFFDTYNISIVDYISKTFKNPLKGAINTVIMTAVDLRLLLIAQLYNSTHGHGTDERSLSRIIMLRKEIDLANIKALFQEKIGKSLGDTVKSDTSGDYQSLLMTLLGEK